LHPDWSYTQVIHQVLSTVGRLPGLEGKVATGGQLDLAAAVGVGAGTSSAPRVAGSSALGAGASPLSGVRLTFDVSMNPRTFTPADVRLVGPGGRAVRVQSVRVVPGTGNRAFDVLFPPQTTPGTYALKVGPQVRDRDGELMAAFLGDYTVHGRVSHPGHRHSGHHGHPGHPGHHRHGHPGHHGHHGHSHPGHHGHSHAGHPTHPARRHVTVWSSSPVTITRRGHAVSSLWVKEGFRIADVAVRLSVSFPRDGDLSLVLEAPDGTRVALAERVGGRGANFTDTVFEDRAARRLGAGRAPFAGPFKPAAPLRELAGKEARGVWRLWVENNSGTHAGRLDGWSLVFSRA
jgi:subtilisin-like proprotein convertase family protein